MIPMSCLKRKKLKLDNLVKLFLPIWSFGGKENSWNLFVQKKPRHWDSNREHTWEMILLRYPADP